jgi:acyl-CoA reductase-like NAD-dependent aldehyde dehydrogenase
VRERLARAELIAGRVAHGSVAVEHPEYPAADVRTPLISRLDAAADRDIYTTEWFGPISFVIATDSTEQSLEVFRETVRRHGALTALVYSTSDTVLAAAEESALDAGVHLSENLTGGLFVNQSTAFSDFHGSAANPAASATLCDPAFVTGRFTTLQSRRPVRTTSDGETADA